MSLLLAGVSTAHAAPLAVVVQAFADAWGFPAAAALTVLNIDGSQSSVLASELTVGSQARTPSIHAGKQQQQG